MIGGVAFVVSIGGCSDGGSSSNSPDTGGALGTGGTCTGGACQVGTGGAEAGRTTTGGATTGGAPAGGTTTGGTTTGGAATGGMATGGTSAGGTTTGGAPLGGVNTGGAPTGGTTSGGALTGGATTGGSPAGGVTTGGTTTGGTATGGTAAGGSGGGVTVPFILGADISSTQETNSTYQDTDGQTKSIFELLKNHGFNYIRLKTFVDPSAPYGYASNTNGCAGLSEPYGDRDHVVAYGKLAKDAGMGFLLDFHYSDIWADPGKQIIPDAWRDATSITDMAARLKAYTKDVITTAVAAGARPDMVQVGNEITPGMCMHVPNGSTDCWGNNVSNAPIGGSTSNWNDLAALLNAGIEGVREVDPNIQIVLHIENHSAAAGWVNSAVSHGVDFDILGLSCYVKYQGQPSVWQTTFNNLAQAHPDLKFIIAEYNPERTQANLVMKNLPNGQGLGTFFWEPTRSGDWGDAMFSWQGNVGVANASDFAEYDDLLPQLGL